MGITISSPNNSIDIGYFGFYNLRQTIANLLEKKEKEKLEFFSLGQHYKDSIHPPIDKERAERFWKEYDEITDSLYERCEKRYRKVFDFLYASDCDASITYGTCKQLLDLIGDYNDNVLYGYSGRSDCARFSDFKNLLSDCVKTKKPLKWM